MEAGDNLLPSPPPPSRSSCCVAPREGGGSASNDLASFEVDHSNTKPGVLCYYLHTGYVAIGGRREPTVDATPHLLPSCPQAVTEYLEKVATQYPNGLPTFKVDHSAFIMPRRIEERVDLEVRTAI